ncbi:hypothetical protein TNIN_94981 [Trichonephila inaurata madagascariensis]|uniref:Uncharacterized protein n=1 Tax=Trichonephila inaurata madagascariensis TaxID=2747483 RepID=A0A8X6WVT3_9ARAC|nr:hypothetical protein TNIN_94981 [Trichonephila inaurata madagascariensis]
MPSKEINRQGSSKEICHLLPSVAFVKGPNKTGGVLSQTFGKSFPEVTSDNGARAGRETHSELKKITPAAKRGDALGRRGKRWRHQISKSSAGRRKHRSLAEYKIGTVAPRDIKGPERMHAASRVESGTAFHILLLRRKDSRDEDKTSAGTIRRPREETGSWAVSCKFQGIGCRDEVQAAAEDI